MKSLLRTVTGGILLGIVATTGANAAYYQTTIDYVPEGGANTSLDPADGNQIIIDWETGLLSGPVESSNLSNLTFTLYGNGSLLYQDAAIIGGVTQDIGGISRDLSDIWFSFADILDLDSLFYFDNDLHNVANNSTGEIYNMYGGTMFGSYIYTYKKIDGDTKHPESTYQSSVPIYTMTKIQPEISSVPLPAALPLYAGGLALLGFLGGRRKRKALAPA